MRWRSAPCGKFGGIVAPLRDVSGAADRKLEDSVAASQENAPASKLNGMTRDIPLFRE
jgi:hypothetical protein